MHSFAPLPSPPQVTKIRISSLIGNTYHARVHYARGRGIKDPEFAEVDVDARPSGGLGVARGGWVWLGGCMSMRGRQVGCGWLAAEGAGCGWEGGCRRAASRWGVGGWLGGWADGLGVAGRVGWIWLGGWLGGWEGGRVVGWVWLGGAMHRGVWEGSLRSLQGSDLQQRWCGLAAFGWSAFVFWLAVGRDMSGWAAARWLGCLGLDCRPPTCCAKDPHCLWADSAWTPSLPFAASMISHCLPFRCCS